MAVISTVAGRCRRCYKCIRSCPAHAVRMKGGQAEVIAERCVACGTCVRICTQKAKLIESHIERLRQFLGSEKPVVACLAPSFPAAYDGIQPLQLVTAIKRLGFARVVEVAFGAQLVAAAYEKLISGNPEQTWITTPCPAIVKLVEKHYPRLVPFLAPIVSPMIATGRVVKQLYMPGALTVFIGPCTAKKLEMDDPSVVGAIDAVLTFTELQALLEEKGIKPAELPESATDGPRPGPARLFPITGELLTAANLQAGLTNTDIILTEGRERIISILEDKVEEKINGKLLALLFCEGCINGPVMHTSNAPTSRKEAVVRYLRSVQNEEQAKADCERYGNVDLSRRFASAPLVAVKPTESEIRAVLTRTRKLMPEDELNCGACGYGTCREKAVAVIHGLAEAEMCLPYLIDELQKTHETLVQMERLASVGQMAAGVAHEINNLLSGIQVYIRLLQRSLKEKRLKEDDLQSKLTTIETEIARCSKIIRGLLDFARPSEPDLRRLNINDVVVAALNVLAAEAQMAGVVVQQRFESNLPAVLADSNQLVQVFTNLGLNAIQAMPKGGTLEVITAYNPQEKQVTVSLIDTGIGIPPEHIPRLFTPFFSTKEKGKGIGLGLAVTHGIIQRHGGQIQVESKGGEGTKFTVLLPVS